MFTDYLFEKSGDWSIFFPGENVSVAKNGHKCNLISFSSAEVAEELCKTAHSVSHDMPLLPSKSRTLHKHTENKENIEGGLDGHSDHSTHSHSGTSRHAHALPTPHYGSAGMPDNNAADTQKQLQRRQARRLKRQAVIFLTSSSFYPESFRASKRLDDQHFQ